MDGREITKVAMAGDTEALREILETGGSILAPNERLQTPLHLAARGGHLEAVLLLLEYGEWVCEGVQGKGKQQQSLRFS